MMTQMESGEEVGDKEKEVDEHRKKSGEKRNGGGSYGVAKTERQAIHMSTTALLLKSSFKLSTLF